MNMVRPRLLIADDELVHRHVLEQIFAPDHDLLIASSGEQALALSAQATPNLVLLDFEMPGIGGLETCRRLKANPATAAVPVIFVTNHDGPQHETAGLDAGAADFIRKPIHPDVVRMRVKAQLQLRLKSEELQLLVFQDALTAVFNRRYFDLHFEHEWQIARRNRQPLSLVLIDVDHFKAYNDHCGHPQGDACLREVAHLLTDTVRRPGDLVARYGGEEFVCLLADVGSAGALAVAEKIAAALKDAWIDHPRSPAGPRLTLSIGVATARQPSGAPEGLVAYADELLYAAKAAGRNQIKVGQLSTKPAIARAA